jgi:hypothetical protein
MTAQLRTEPAVAPPAGDEQALRRPDLRHLLWYCYGGSLHARHHTWVLHDVTCRTWWLRHFGRWLMVIVPFFALYMALVPTPFGIRLYTGLTFSGAIFMFALVNIMIDTDRRAVRAGYSFNYPQQLRSARAVERQRAANYERRERAAERHARRGR